MNYLIRGGCFLGGCLLSSLVFAVDVPSVEEGAQQYDKGACLARYTQNCIQSVCMTSSSTDCQENCQKEAADKCQQEQD